MNKLAIVGCALVGGVVGAAAGFALGLREDDDDFCITPVFFALAGVPIGGFLGVVVGAVVFG